MYSSLNTYAFSNPRPFKAEGFASIHAKSGGGGPAPTALHQSYSMPAVCRLYVAAGVSNTRIGARAFVASSHHVHGKHCTMREN